ncbi:hypothetical protein BDQ17DRAFT_1327452 [Cyathus striatus]|nr:hypothetical protein BDQ17DRAFT_1327452 [Cyathus striatus]
MISFHLLGFPLYAIAMLQVLPAELIYLGIFLISSQIVVVSLTLAKMHPTTQYTNIVRKAARNEGELFVFALALSFGPHWKLTIYPVLNDQEVLPDSDFQCFHG